MWVAQERRQETVMTRGIDMSLQPANPKKRIENWGKHSLYSTVQLWLLWRRRTMTTIRHKQKKKMKKKMRQTQKLPESTFYFYCLGRGYCCLDLEMSDEKERLKNNKSARNLLIEKGEKRRKSLSSSSSSSSWERDLWRKAAVDKAPPNRRAARRLLILGRSLIWIVKN